MKDMLKVMLGSGWRGDSNQEMLNSQVHNFSRTPPRLPREIWSLHVYERWSTPWSKSPCSHVTYKKVLVLRPLPPFLTSSHTMLLTQVALSVSLKRTKPVLTPGPLHLLFAVSGALFPQIFLIIRYLGSDSGSRKRHSWVRTGASYLHSHLSHRLVQPPVLTSSVFINSWAYLVCTSPHPPREKRRGRPTHLQQRQQPRHIVGVRLILITWLVLSLWQLVKPISALELKEKDILC